MEFTYCSWSNANSVRRKSHTADKSNHYQRTKTFFQHISSLSFTIIIYITAKNHPRTPGIISRR